MTMITPPTLKSYEDVVPYALDDSRGIDQPRVDRLGEFGGSDKKLQRRTVLKGFVGVGTAVALYALGAIPLRRPAGASHAEGWSIQPANLQCPGFNHTEYPNCRGCYPSPICGSCCFTHINGKIYHKTSYWDGYDHRPDQCPPGTGYDGWYWTATGCEGCSGSKPTKKWRCHDGKKWTSSGWGPTICADSYCI